MIKLLSSADWHINLHKKKIPYNWQLNRFQLMFKKLRELEASCDIHVIAGDLFDKKPEPDEICLLLSYVNSVTIPTIIIPGNHEATAKGKSFWEHFKLENSITNPNIHILTSNERVNILNQWFQAFPYGSVQIKEQPEYHNGDILVTHIRGEVIPHITEEYDFELLRAWKLILLGDLHFRHKYKDFPAYYPGSPLNTTYDRDTKRKYGVDVINFNSIDDYDVTFVDLDLPKLVRKTVTIGTELTPDDKHHVVYEVTGSIDQLAKLDKSDLLDKKMVTSSKANSILDLKDKTDLEELVMYLDYIKIADKESVINEYKELGIQ